MKKILLSSLLATSIFAFAYTQTDVSNAKYLADNNIITKQSDETKYRLNDTITRAEVVAIALKIKGIKDPSSYKCKKYYSDTVQNDWICRAVEMAADNGLVARANTKFRSQEKITRAEALAMLMKAGNISIKLNCGDCGGTVIDSEIQWQYDVFVNAYLAKIISPDKKIEKYSAAGPYYQHIYRPNSYANRAEVFEFAKNMLTYTKKSSGNSSITFEDAWTVYAELVKYMKNKDINGINTLSYNPIDEDMTDCSADCQEMMGYMIKNTFERFLGQKERFKFVYSDSKQIILSTGIIKVTAEETFWGSSGYVINSLLFAKDNSGKLKFINFGGAEYGDGYTESGLIDTDNDDIIDKDETCENLADKYSGKCIKTDPKNPDTNNDGWWDGIEKAMQRIQ